MSARDALAKALKAAGDTDASAAVKKLRRPTFAAAAVNRLAHTDPAAIEALLVVGDRLRAAHEELIDGEGRAAVRAATAERRRLVATLTERAAALLPDVGDASRESISSTLDAAVADAGAGAAVRGGRLVKELEPPSGFGAGLVFAAAPPPGDAAAREQRRAARRARRDQTEAAAQPGFRTVEARPTGATVRKREGEARPTGTAVRKALREKLKEAVAAADAARAAARKAAKDAATVREDLRRLRAELGEAEARLPRAEETAKLAQWTAARAQDELDAAEQAVAEAAGGGPGAGAATRP